MINGHSFCIICFTCELALFSEGKNEENNPITERIFANHAEDKVLGRIFALPE